MLKARSRGLLGVIVAGFQCLAERKTLNLAEGAWQRDCPSAMLQIAAYFY